MNTGEYGGCDSECKRMPYCGDGIVTDPEVCDDGVNDGSYGGCAKSCMSLGGYCGDEKVQKEAGEECDYGTGNNDETYGGCTTSCKFGPFCGDGIVNGSEECDYKSSEACSQTCRTLVN